MAHEQLFTTTGFEASTKLLAVRMNDIPRDLLNFGKYPGPTAMSYLAVSRYTMVQEPEGALCLFYHWSPNSKDEAVRIYAHPVLIRNRKGLRPKLQETNILVAHTLLNNRINKLINTMLIQRSGSSRAYAWTGKPSTQLRT